MKPNGISQGAYFFKKFNALSLVKKLISTGDGSVCG